jgi:hypothetical protein
MNEFQKVRCLLSGALCYEHRPLSDVHEVSLGDLARGSARRYDGARDLGDPSGTYQAWQGGPSRGDAMRQQWMWVVAGEVAGVRSPIARA